jgi:uncharacterized protein YndB with AHSA1/START domain
MSAEKNTVAIETLFPSPVEEVWRAWTEPATMMKWIGSDPRGRGVGASLDVRPGGRFALSFENSDGSSFTASGVYREVVPPHHLTFTWAWANEPGPSSYVDISLISRDDGTLQLFRHENLDPASAHDYEAGWNSTFSKLRRTLFAPRLLQDFNETIGQWIGFLDDYTLEMLQQPPRADSWSLGQVYRHIIDDTQWVVEQMERTMDRGANENKELHENARAMFQNNDFPDRMIKGPSTGKAIAQPTGKTQLAEELISIREAVNKLFADGNVAAATAKTGHPGLGYFTTLEWLQFAEMHMRHHFRQKKRIDEQLFISRP